MQDRRVVARVFDAVIGHFEKQPLLGVHPLGFAAGDPEKRRIKLIDVLEEAPPAGIDVAGLALLRVEITAPVPAVCRDFADGAMAAGQIAPERGHRFGAGITAVETDDRNRNRVCAVPPGRGGRHPGVVEARHAIGLRHRRGHGLRRGLRGGGPLVRTLFDVGLLQQRLQLGVTMLDEMLGQRRQRGSFKKQRTVDGVEMLVEDCGQANDQDRIQAIVHQGAGQAHLVRRNLQRRGHQPAQAFADPLPPVVRRRGLVPRRAGIAVLPAGGGQRRRRLPGPGGRLPHDPVALGQDDLLAQAMGRPGREQNRAEPFLLQHRLPPGRRQPGTARNAQRAIPIAPPAFEQAEAQMGEQGGFADFIEHQQATLAQGRLGMAQRLTDLRRGMQHVVRHHEVIVIGGDALLGTGAGHIEQPRLQERVVPAESLGTVLQEGLGQIGVAVFADLLPPGRKRRQQTRRGTAGACADFENPQRLGVRRTAFEIGQGRFDQHLVEVIGDPVVLVDPFHQGHRAIGKEKAGRRLRAGQQGGQALQAGIEQQRPGRQVGVPAPVCQPLVPLLPERVGIAGLDTGDIAQALGQPGV